MMEWKEGRQEWTRLLRCLPVAAAADDPAERRRRESERSVLEGKIREYHALRAQNGVRSINGTIHASTLIRNPRMLEWLVDRFQIDEYASDIPVPLGCSPADFDRWMRRTGGNAAARQLGE